MVRKIVNGKVVVVEPAIGEEVIAIAPEEIQAHLQRGKAHFEATRYTEALREFEAILMTAPGNIETRIWIRKAKNALAEPRIEAVTEEARPKYCVWMRIGMVSYRLCTSNYDCLTCEFDQEMQDKMVGGGAPELDAALERLKELRNEIRYNRSPSGKRLRHKRNKDKG